MIIGVLLSLETEKNKIRIVDRHVNRVPSVSYYLTTYLFTYLLTKSVYPSYLL